MTDDENSNKVARKEAIKKKLSKLHRKILLCSEMLSKARDCQKLLKNEYEHLDRELFEQNQGIKVLKAKEKAPKTETKILSNYKNMSVENQKAALSRLLEIQANMSQKA